MEENSANFAKMARLLAFIHIITGVLLLVFGIADKLVQYKRQQESGVDCHGIWTGIWVSNIIIFLSYELLTKLRIREASNKNNISYRKTRKCVACWFRLAVFTLEMDCSSETGYPLSNLHQTDNTSYFENGTVLILDEQY